MADHDLKRSFRSRDGAAPFVVFLILSLVSNGVGAYCGWWLKFPEPPPAKDEAIQLTDIDTNDVQKLGDPNAPEEPPPPEPEPTPPPPEPEPTPPPLDKPPEFEIPQATPPGLSKGSLTGAPDGTGNGGPRSGLLVRSPRPPYPSQALQLHLSGDVHVRMTVQGGNIVDAEGSGPPMLASAAARWVRSNWKFSPTTNGTYTLPVSFVLAH